MAAQVRDIMRERATWTGTASDLLQFGANFTAILARGRMAKISARSCGAALSGTNATPCVGDRDYI
jgi:hypothetical protein